MKDNKKKIFKKRVSYDIGDTWQMWLAGALLMIFIGVLNGNMDLVIWGGGFFMLLLFTQILIEIMLSRKVYWEEIKNG